LTEKKRQTVEQEAMDDYFRINKKGKNVKLESKQIDKERQTSQQEVMHSKSAQSLTRRDAIAE